MLSTSVRLRVACNSPRSLRHSSKSLKGDLTAMGHSKNSFLRRVVVAGATLTGLLIFAGAPTLRGDDGRQRRGAKAHHHPHEGIEHHGYQNEEAGKWGQILQEERE